jgi:D-arabinose 1-dehydrogenase-like Zn-dependent alcohol dehydrogenase
MIKLTQEQRAALAEYPDGVPCHDDATQRVYFLVDEQTHQQAMAALKQQGDLVAVGNGIAQMQAGAGTPLAEAREELATELGFSQPPE